MLSFAYIENCRHTHLMWLGGNYIWTLYIQNTWVDDVRNCLVTRCGCGEWMYCDMCICEEKPNRKIITSGVIYLLRQRQAISVLSFSFFFNFISRCLFYFWIKVNGLNAFFFSSIWVSLVVVIKYLIFLEQIVQICWTLYFKNEMLHFVVHEHEPNMHLHFGCDVRFIGFSCQMYANKKQMLRLICV